MGIIKPTFQPLPEVMATEEINSQVLAGGGRGGQISASLNSASQEKVLFIGAHPDDIELGCGGSLLKYIEKGDDVYVVLLSKGEKGVGGKTEKRADVTVRIFTENGIQRKNISVLNIPDTKFAHHREKIFKSVEDICIKYGITKAYTHTNKEYHQDHIVVHEESLRAARNVPSILAYESNAHTYPTFSPVYFQDISAYIDRKLKLIQSHQSQKEKKYCSSENILANAKFRGYQSRTSKYAEAFEIIRLVQL